MKILLLSPQRFYELHSKLLPPSREELPLTCPNFLMRIYDTLVLREDRAELSQFTDLNEGPISIAAIVRSSVMTGEVK
jgi:hypothetical protein